MNRLKINKLHLDGAAVVENIPFEDNRGCFARFFCQNELSSILGRHSIINVNYSQTVKRGSIRGLHFQYAPSAEMKLVRCIRGIIYDVLVDIRKQSPTFLQWYGVELSAENKKMAVVPEGFAHGFQSLMDNSEILYLTTASYDAEREGGLHFNDPVLNIDWPLAVTDISEKDRMHAVLSNAFVGVDI